MKWPQAKSRGNTEFRLVHLSGLLDGDFVACIRVIYDAHSMQPVNYVRTRRASSRPRDNGKMNAKWRTQRHLSIRDLDWRSLFLSDSSFHAIDDRTGLRERSGSSFLSFFFPLLLRFVFFFRNGYTTIVHIATMVRRWTWIIMLRRSFPAFPRLSSASHERVYSCLLRRMILSVISVPCRDGFTRISCFSCFHIFLAFLNPRQLRNHRNRRNATKYFQNFYTCESSTIKTSI